MEKSQPVASLHLMILAKEAENELEAKELKLHFHLTYESLKPVNIIRNLFNDVVSDPSLKTSAINSVIGMAAGALVKKIVTPKTNNPFTKLLGMAVEMIVANKVTNNADDIKSVAGILAEKIMNQTKAK